MRGGDIVRCGLCSGQLVLDLIVVEKQQKLQSNTKDEYKKESHAAHEM
jgi:hypothetical protein